MSGRLACFLVLVSSLLSPVCAQTQSAEDLQLALGLIQRGMHDDAARQLERFLERNPRHARRAEAGYRLGTCYVEMQQNDPAIAAFRGALAGGKFDLRAECRYKLGHALEQSDDHAGAGEQFRLLVTEEGEDHYLAAPSFYALGESLRQNGKDAEALTSYAKAAALDKVEGGQFAVSSLYQAGFIQLRAAEFTAAEQLFGSAADRFPDHDASRECRFLQGEAALRAGRHDAARKAFDQVVRAGGEYVDDALLGLGQSAAEQGRGDEALGHFSTLIQRQPDSPLVPQAMLEAGRSLYKDGQHENAVSVLGQLLDRDRLDQNVRWPALELRALAHLDSGTPVDAAADLQAAIRLAQIPADQGRMLYSLGEAYADVGNWQEALAAYGRCEELSSDPEQRGDALYAQCLALHRLEQFQASNQLVAKFKRDHGGHRLAMQTQFALAENQFALQQYPDADKAYAMIPDGHALAVKAAFKRAWCSYLVQDFKSAASRFATLANRSEPADASVAEESLSMQALALLEAGDFAPALSAADRYRDSYSDGGFLARTERVAARVLRQQGKLRAAASRLANAANVETSSDRAFGDRVEMAEVLFGQGDYDAAKAVYADLVDRPDKIGARAREGMAWCAFELGDDEACKNWIERGLEHESIGAERASLLELLSALHHRRQEWPQARTAAERYLADHADHERAPEMRYSLGVSMARQGALPDAKSLLESLRDAELERLDRVFYELAWVYRRLEDEPAALVAFGQVANLSKDENLAGETCLQIGEAMLKGEGDTDEALGWLQQVKGKYTARAQYLSGFTEFEREQFEQALGHFNRVLGDEGELASEARFFAGECLFRQEKYSAASEHYAGLLDTDAEHERGQLARLHHGQSLVRSDRPAEASTVLREYLRRAGLPDSDVSKGDLARGNLWLGKALQQDEQYEAAEQAFREVTVLTESELSAEAQFRIGESRMSRGLTTDAVDAFVKLSILYGHEEWVQRGLSSGGDCYVQLKQPQKAVKLYEELIRRFPESSLAKSAQSKLERIRSK